MNLPLCTSRRRKEMSKYMFDGAIELGCALLILSAHAFLWFS